jgi:hypothetical protein
MESTSPGQLVKVAGASRPVDGIVFDTPSSTKVVVAVIDRGRGPIFRTVNPSTLSEREGAGPDDRALQLLIRRTPHPKRGGGRGGASSEQAHDGHTRAAMHRTTGK